MFHLPTSALAVAALLIGGAAVASTMPQSPGASNFVAITPCRLVDTRPSGPQVGSRGQPLGQLEEVSFAVRGSNGDCTIPSTATAVNVNITTLNGSATSHLRAYPTGTAAPNSSINNWMAGQGPTPNGASLALSATGELTLRNQTGTVDVIVDVLGFYEPAQQQAVDPVTTVPATTTPAQVVIQGGSSYNVPFEVSKTSGTILTATPLIAPTSGTLYLEYQGTLANNGSVATTVGCIIRFYDVQHPGIFGVSVPVPAHGVAPIRVSATGRVRAGEVTTQLRCSTDGADAIFGGPQWHSLFVSDPPVAG